MKIIAYILPFTVGLDKTQIFEWDAPGPTAKEALEQAFEEFNIGADRQCRSMSVGDVVKIDAKYFYCDSAGWKEIGEAQLHELEQMGFSDRHFAFARVGSGLRYIGPDKPENKPDESIFPGEAT